jgi:superfamily II DNA or RNA helicase/very-short-patch-repair endonuclease
LEIYVQSLTKNTDRRIAEKIILIIANEIFIERKGLPQSLLNRFIRIAAFQNPAFYKAQAMRLSTYGIPRIIGCAYDHSHHIGLPRGCLDEIIQLLKELKVEHTLQDELFSEKTLDVHFQGSLRSEQENAAATLLQSDIGVLSATTAFGKTVVAAYLIAKRKVNVLIIVHTKQLQDQWVERLQTFLKMPDKTVGRLGGGRKKVTGLIDVVLIQSLIRKEDVAQFVGQYGYVIIDECHHVPSVNFEKVMRHVKARFITGLSATVIRKDGHHPIITMRCGPIRYSVNAKQQAIARPFEHHVIVRPTAFCPEKILQEDLRLQFQDLCNEIINDVKRNQLICNDVINAVEKGRSPIVLTERNEHVDLLYSTLSSKIKHLIVLRGSLSKCEMIDAINRLKSIPPEESRVILATGRFVGEGFDDARLDTLFLTLPISWKGTIAQYAGRLHRLYDLKKEVLIYDYTDFSVPMLERMFNRRCKAYEAIGYRIIMPASAYHGWPADVSLPADPAWKMNFTKTVQCLIRDGVDPSLAKLFADVSSQNSNINRARSHVEAFLFCRLETLDETKGRFQLNQHLSIPFDGLGKMEVDFLCADSNVVVEIDGMQHLSSAEAYRRDRRKDILLQENGYKILRFLAEDVMKQLDLVLDVILRTIKSSIYIKEKVENQY